MALGKGLAVQARRPKFRSLATMQNAIMASSTKNNKIGARGGEGDRW